MWVFMKKLVLSLLLTSILSPICFSKESSVLYIGDSQSAGHLGRNVYKHLNKTFEGNNIELFGISSSSPRHWGAIKTSKNGVWICDRVGRHNLSYEIPLFTNICIGEDDQSAFGYLNSFKPEYVIFQFLGNSAALDKNSIKKRCSALT